MINLLLGPSGGGKSYEANVFHVLVAVQQGRKVITNLPINLDYYAAIEPRSRELIEIRTASKGTRRVEAKPGEYEIVPAPVFGAIEDYGSDWRHPDPKKGYGPLYVIDECHKALPSGAGTPRIVREWYAEHRHEQCDVLLITQSYGKIHKDIRDNAQLVYRVKKANFLGRSNSYIRKVQEGVRGEVVAITEREYEPKYFKLYKSHTKSLGAAVEALAEDVSPLFLKVRRLGFFVMFLGVVFLAATVANKFRDRKPPQKTTATAEHGARSAASTPRAARELAPPPTQPVPTPSAPAEPSQPEKAGVVAVSEPVRHPFEGLGVHVLGHIDSAGARLFLFGLSQNGQMVHRLYSRDFSDAGYTVEVISECVAKLSYGEWTKWVRCDYPTTSTGVATSVSQPGNG